MTEKTAEDVFQEAIGGGSVKVVDESEAYIPFSGGTYDGKEIVEGYLTVHRTDTGQFELEAEVSYVDGGDNYESKVGSFSTVADAVNREFYKF